MDSNYVQEKLAFEGSSDGDSSEEADDNGGSIIDVID